MNDYLPWLESLGEGRGFRISNRSELAAITVKVQMKRGCIWDQPGDDGKPVRVDSYEWKLTIVEDGFVIASGFSQIEHGRALRFEGAQGVTVLEEIEWVGADAHIDLTVN